MKCPTCRQSELVHDTRNIKYTYKGESTTLPKITGDFCKRCDEVITDREESARLSKMMLNFNKQVNASKVDPEFIFKVRKKLNYDQQEAAKVFGGGVNAFSKYESGKTKPPIPLVQLFRILDRHPELARELPGFQIFQNYEPTAIRHKLASEKENATMVFGSGPRRSAIAKRSRGSTGKQIALNKNAKKTHSATSRSKAK